MESIKSKSEHLIRVIVFIFADRPESNRVCAKLGLGSVERRILFTAIVACRPYLAKTASLEDRDRA